MIGLGDGGAHVQFHGGYGYLTKLLGEWVREKQVMTLEQAVRRLTFDSADHSLARDLSAEQRDEMRRLIGDLFDTRAHWFHFTLNEHAGPYTFPQFTARAERS